MSDLSITAVSCGRWQTNCVVVADHGSEQAIVVDPGEGAGERVPAVLERLGVEPTAVLLTHGHLDHLWAAPVLARAFDVDVHLHPADRWLWDNPGATLAAGIPADRARDLLRAQLGLDWRPDADRLVDLEDDARLALAGQRIDVAHTPGHTPGSVTFLLRGVTGADVVVDVGDDAVAPEDVLVAGDFLFAGSIGRTDLPGGDHEAMLGSLRAQVPRLADDVLVLPGHGPTTTVGAERSRNPFVQQALRQHR